MNKFKVIILLLQLMITININAQKQKIKNLYYYENDPIFQSCGTTIEAGILYFVADTTEKNKKSNEYFIAVMCPTIYGDNFFRKGFLYKLILNRDFKSIKKYIGGNGYEMCRKNPNFYVAIKIHLIPPL